MELKELKTYYETKIATLAAIREKNIEAKVAAYRETLERQGNEEIVKCAECLKSVEILMKDVLREETETIREVEHCDDVITEDEEAPAVEPIGEPEVAPMERVREARAGMARIEFPRR